jgi:TetR/AcrR family transcriptional regulator, transcriptional repressor for nem operon
MFSSDSMLDKKTEKKTGSSRDPLRTRALLLNTAFAEVYRSSFQATGLDRILEKAKVTKGALYHHFASKEELGYAIVDEVITGITLRKWVNPLADTVDAIDTLIDIVQGTSLSATDVEKGCPLNNLAQEMSPVDEGFRKRVGRVFRLMIGSVSSALLEGQKRGQVRPEIDPEETATFFIATYEGYLGLAKNAQDPGVLRSGIRTMTSYLEGLRTRHA